MNFRSVNLCTWNLKPELNDFYLDYMNFEVMVLSLWN